MIAVTGNVVDWVFSAAALGGLLVLGGVMRWSAWRSLSPCERLWLEVALTDKARTAGRKRRARRRKRWGWLKNPVSP